MMGGGGIGRLGRGEGVGVAWHPLCVLVLYFAVCDDYFILSTYHEYSEI